MSINGKTLTAVEALVTATDTSEGDFRTGMDDVLFQVDENQVASSDVVSERDRVYLQIRNLRAGNWDYLTSYDNGASAAARLAHFGDTDAVRAGRYRFIVVAGGGGGTSTHGGGAGGMYAFDYLWDGTTALDWTVGENLTNVATGSTSTLTLPSGYVATALGGENGNVNLDAVAGAGGGTTLSAVSDDRVTNVLRRVGGNGLGASGGAVNVLGLLPDDGTTTRGASSQGGSVWGNDTNQFGEDATNVQNTSRPGGLWMGNMPAMISSQQWPMGTSVLDRNSLGFASKTFGLGGAVGHSPGLFGGWSTHGVGLQTLQQNSASRGAGGGGGGSSTGRGTSGVICWCRMGPI